MSKKRGLKKKMGIDLPRYKVVIPCILCAYMILSTFIPDMDNKSVLLSVIAICMVAWFIGERIFPDRVYKEQVKSHNRYIYILGGIFILMTVLSEIFAKDYSGAYLVGEHDSFSTIFGYVVLFYMAYRYGYMEEGQKVFRYAVVIISVITVSMSVLEFLDMPIATLWSGNAGGLDNRNRVILTFGNSNYYGAFCCMLIPFIMELWLSASDRLKKILLIVLNGSLVCCVVMSKSTLAIYLMIFIFIAICIYEFKTILKQWIGFICFASVIVLLGVLLNICSSGKMLELIKVGVGNADAFVEENVNEQERYIVEDIRLDGNRLVIESDDSSFIMEYSESFTFYDEDGNVLDIETNEGMISFVDEPYDVITVSVSYNQDVAKLYIEIDAGYKETIDFYISEGVFAGVGADGGAVEDINGNHQDYEFNSMFTGRGYIWINTLSMLDDVIFIGKGCGNFVHNFKQYDYVGLLKSQGTHNVIIDRPHNMFLQYSVDIGIIGTVALFALITYVLIGWIKQRVKQGRDDSPLSVASFMAVIGFMIFTLLNDSLVNLSPYMWVFLGLNMSVQWKSKHGKNIQ